MDNIHEEVLLRMKTMDRLLSTRLKEIPYIQDDLDGFCYTLRMYTEWMIGTVGTSSSSYSEFAKLKDSFLTFEVMLTLDNEEVNTYVVGNLFSQIIKFHNIVGELIEALEEAI